MSKKSSGGIGRKKRQGNKTRTADALFSRLVRSRGHCEAAGKDAVECGGVLQCAHIEGRRKYALRWDEMNALCLCAGHHRYYTNLPIAWALFVRAHFPKQFRYVSSKRNELWDRDVSGVLSALRAKLADSEQMQREDESAG